MYIHIYMYRQCIVIFISFSFWSQFIVFADLKVGLHFLKQRNYYLYLVGPNLNFWINFFFLFLLIFYVACIDLKLKIWDCSLECHVDSANFGLFCYNWILILGCCFWGFLSCFWVWSLCFCLCFWFCYFYIWLSSVGAGLIRGEKVFG